MLNSCAAALVNSLAIARDGAQRDLGQLFQPLKLRPSRSRAGGQQRRRLGPAGVGKRCMAWPRRARFTQALGQAAGRVGTPALTLEQRLSLR